MIEINEVSKNFLSENGRRQVLEKVNLSVGKGELWQLTKAGLRERA